MNEEIEKLFQEYKKEWRSSTSCSVIKRSLKGVVQTQIKPIDTAALFGVGCFRFQDDEHSGHRPFVGQLVIFLDLIDYLANTQARAGGVERKDINMFAADPSF
jgi:hypothetical protein